MNACACTASLPISRVLPIGESPSVGAKNCECSATPTAERCLDLPFPLTPFRFGDAGNCVCVRWRGVLGPCVPSGGNCLVSCTDGDGEGGDSISGVIGVIGCSAGAGDGTGAGTGTGAGAGTGTGTTGSLGCSIACNHNPSASSPSSVGSCAIPSNSNNSCTAALLMLMHVSKVIMGMLSRRESWAHMCRSIDLLPVLVRLKNTVYLSSVSSNETSSGVGS